MNLLFLGTCACDYSPKLKTELNDKFDFDARRSSSALLNGHVLIDCGDHTLDSLRIAGIDKSKITDVVITHLHHDHFRADHIEYIAGQTESKLRLWVRADAILPDIKNVDVIRIKPLSTYELDGDMKITGLRANHDENSYPQYLYIEDKYKKLLYATDGAWFISETYYWLRNKSVDTLIIDATCGDYIGDYRMAEHNSIPIIRMMLPSLKTWGVVGDKTKIYLTHIAPSLHKPHEEIVKSVKNDGICVAFDGLKINI